jgi:cell wall-associated NlpC family hydrolase
VIRRALLASVLTAATGIGLTGALAAPAQAATPRPIGGISAATQYTAAHSLTLRGWAYDRSSSHASIAVTFWIDGRYAGKAKAAKTSAYENHRHHISGKHNFTVTLSWPASAKQVTIRSRGVKTTAARLTLASRAVTHVAAGPGDRIVSIAKRFVGKARYVAGGTTPAGFDCSGYTQYVYAQANVKALPRTAEQQRRAKGMRLITAAQARPGDLVFYLAGGEAYHVAIYAGHGMQYAAATPRDGIRYQAVWSSSVQYRTDWH